MPRRLRAFSSIPIQNNSGEGETEWFYFESLRIACRYPFKDAPDFPRHSDIHHILKLVDSYLNKQYDYVVCLFDMDRLFRYPSEMQLYQRAKKKYNAKKYAGYFIRTYLYKYLTENGDLKRAVSNSEKLCQLCRELPEDLKAYSEIHKVIGLLNKIGL